MHRNLSISHKPEFQIDWETEIWFCTLLCLLLEIISSGPFGKYLEWSLWRVVPLEISWVVPFPRAGHVFTCTCIHLTTNIPPRLVHLWWIERARKASVHQRREEHNRAFGSLSPIDGQSSNAAGWWQPAHIAPSPPQGWHRGGTADVALNRIGRRVEHCTPWCLKRLLLWLCESVKLWWIQPFFVPFSDLDSCARISCITEWNLSATTCMSQTISTISWIFIQICRQIYPMFIIPTQRFGRGFRVWGCEWKRVSTGSIMGGRVGGVELRSWWWPGDEKMCDCRAMTATVGEDNEAATTLSKHLLRSTEKVFSWN